MRKNLSLADLEALLNEGRAPQWLDGKELAVEVDRLAKGPEADETKRILQEALALALAELRIVFEQFSTGRWVRSLVVNIANDELDKLGPDNPQAGSLRRFRDDFRSNFAAIAAAPEMEEKTRLAVFKAMFQALAIGVVSSHDAGLVDRISGDAERARARQARKVRANKYAARKEAIVGAVRAVMEATRTRPTRGEAFARLIEPDVNKRLVLEGEPKLSIWTIRNAVRAVLQEAP